MVWSGEDQGVGGGRGGDVGRDSQRVMSGEGQWAGDREWRAVNGEVGVGWWGVGTLWPVQDVDGYEGSSGGGAVW